jgi:hypothetical protein
MIHIQLDIGKIFGSLIVLFSLANAVCYTKYDDPTGVVLSLLQLTFNVVIGLLYWKHEPSMLSITRSVCLISFIVVPAVFLLGVISGKPLNVNLPFYQNSVGSTVGKFLVMLMFSLLIIAIYAIFSTRKAAKEFTSVKSSGLIA